MLKQFFKDSFIYGLSNVITRGIALILLPLYTQVFSPADYGVIEILSIVATIVNLIVALEISQAVALYYADADTESDKIAPDGAVHDDLVGGHVHVVLDNLVRADHDLLPTAGLQRTYGGSRD